MLSMPRIDKLLSKIDILPLPGNTFFGVIVYQPGGTYGPRVQEHYQLVVVYSGHAVIHLDGQTHDLDEEEVALLKPGHYEFFEFAKDSPTHHSWCHFHWHLDDSLTELLETFPFKLPLSNHMRALIDLGLALHRDHHSLSPTSQHLAAAAFWEFASLAAMSSSTSPYGRLPKSLQRVQSFVTSNYQHELTLENLSQVAHVTPEHLIRLFRQHLGTTPMRYVWQIRAQQGVSYLRHTGLSVERIALGCGFKTAAHFSRTIKAQYGQTPLELRQDSSRSSALNAPIDR
jgi:AraC family transcriptional regulator, arabinose operon regulatory protein